MAEAGNPRFVRAEIIAGDELNTHMVSIMTDEGDEYFVLMGDDGLPHLCRQLRRREILDRERRGSRGRYPRVPRAVP
jgi:hypothetical protein